jgi:putative polymerase
VAFAAASFRRLSGGALAFLAISTIAMLFGCDGRFAVVCSVLIIFVSFVASRLPPHSAIVYLPAIVLVMFVIVSSAAIQTGGDDFIGRIAHTKDLLMRFDVQEFFGISGRYIDEAMDSGLAYLIVTQSLPGLILLWMFIAWGPVEHTTEQIRHTHALCLYLALSMLVSYSFLTIKTGALLWFIQGALQSGDTRFTWRQRANSEDNIQSLPKEA